MQSVLLVDDDRDLRAEVSSWIDRSAYTVTEAESADAALDAMDVRPANIAVCDVTMAGRDGVWLAWRIRERFPQTAVILATALRDCETAVSSLRNDVVDYLLKPFDRARLLEAISLGADWHAAAAGADDLHHVLQDRLRARRCALATSLAEAQTTPSAAVDGLIAMMQLHERDARSHATRVARLTVAVADQLGCYSEREIAGVETGALLHDIGKLQIPRSILVKPAPLDDHEWEIMREHPQLGYDLLKKLPGLADAAPMVLSHHEAYDGRGYPRGLKGEQIPLAARVLSLADAYDSMTHPHIQRPAMPPSLAMKEIERCSGSQFDPMVAEALGAVLAGAAQQEQVA